MSWKPNRIVVGTDYSESSRGIVGEAIRLATSLGARLYVVNVSSNNDATREEMDSFLAEEDVPSSLDLRKEIVLGSRVASALAEYAADNKADLICVGPLARGFLEKHVMGGIAEQLLTQSSLPTLTTSAPCIDGYRRILVALDDSAAALKSLRLAAALLEPGGKLLVFTALSGRAFSALSAIDEIDEITAALVSETEQEIRDRCAGVVDFSTTDVEFIIEKGAFASRLAMVVEQHRPNLVAMGTVASKGLLGVFGGSTAGQIVRHLHFPLLIAQP